MTPTSLTMRAADDVSEVRWFAIARVPGGRSRSRAATIAGGGR